MARLILAGTGTLISRSGESEGTAPAIGIPSSQFWAQRLYPRLALSDEAREARVEAGGEEGEEEESGRDESRDCQDLQNHEKILDRTSRPNPQHIHGGERHQSDRRNGGRRP